MEKRNLKTPALGLVIVFSALMIAGCSEQTQGNVKELGNVLKRDVNKAARNVDDAVKDAVD